MRSWLLALVLILCCCVPHMRQQPRHQPLDAPQVAGPWDKDLETLLRHSEGFSPGARAEGVYVANLTSILTSSDVPNDLKFAVSMEILRVNQQTNADVDLSTFRDFLRDKRNLPASCAFVHARTLISAGMIMMMDAQALLKTDASAAGAKFSEADLAIWDGLSKFISAANSWSLDGLKVLDMNLSPSAEALLRKYANDQDYLESDRLAKQVLSIELDFLGSTLSTDLSLAAHTAYDFQERMRDRISYKHNHSSLMGWDRIPVATLTDAIETISDILTEVRLRMQEAHRCQTNPQSQPALGQNDLP